MSEDTKKIIYSMVGVNKNYNGKPIIKDISLSYYYGAKIGVLGLNGSGKSTLLRIMAGVDKEFNGETMLSDGYTVGFLEQEPLIDCDKTVREVPTRIATWKNSASGRPWSRTSSMRWMPGSLIHGSTWPWTLCAARRPIRR
ncbi:MAG: ATP-binding cassette domain-containing protein [Desulfuromonadales bacterium]